VTLRLSSKEIADSLEISPRTVDRKLELIRALWMETALCNSG
jgi:DNA-binding CsgD family transcriptional regulator